MAETQPVTVYKTPKNTLLVVIKAGIAKGLSEWWQILTLGWHAGVFIGLAGGLTVAIAGAMDSTLDGSMPVYDGTETSSGTLSLSLHAPQGLKKLISASLFPLGLVLVVLSGSELFTGNIMYLLAARLANQTTWRKVIKNWTIAYFANLAGCLAVAYFMFHLTELLSAPNYDAYLRGVAASKCHYGNWGQYFLKGIGANYLVCLALWCACTADDTLSKIMAIWYPIMGFICCGFEHSIANMFFVPLAIMNNTTPITASEFVVRNLIPVTIGNMAGGALFIFTQFVIYHPYLTPTLKRIAIKQGDKSSNNNGEDVQVVEGKHVVPVTNDVVGTYVDNMLDYVLCRFNMMPEGPAANKPPANTDYKAANTTDVEAQHGKDTSKHVLDVDKPKSQV